MEILVGKSSLQNDYLTTKLASNKDIWLHTKDIPGSHVIIRTAGLQPTDKTLQDAAVIAAFYSKAKDSSNVPVDYTFIKNVSKPSGSKPGMVIYVNQRTLFVTPDADYVKSLEQQAR
jgi:predicted ribosome quality control (RQC) complex YloA/Tae2 family protein